MLDQVVQAYESNGARENPSPDALVSRNRHTQVRSVPRVATSIPNPREVPIRNRRRNGKPRERDRTRQNDGEPEDESAPLSPRRLHAPAAALPRLSLALLLAVLPLPFLFSLFPLSSSQFSLLSL